MMLSPLRLIGEVCLGPKRSTSLEEKLETVNKSEIVWKDSCSELDGFVSLCGLIYQTYLFNAIIVLLLLQFSRCICSLCVHLIFNYKSTFFSEK